MVEKVTASFKAPEAMQKKLLEAVIKDGYGMRGKSKWVVEAIEYFLELPNYPDLVDIASDSEGLSKMVSIRLPKEIGNKIEQAVLCVRKNYPSAEGVKSNIMRASICQRLIRG